MNTAAGKEKTWYNVNENNSRMTQKITQMDGILKLI
jgi:hypothetical protein